MTRQDEHDLASFLARPDWPRIRPLLAEVLGAPLTKLDELIRRVRREQWKDFSQ